jgi:hypothetical protein
MDSQTVSSTSVEETVAAIKGVPTKTELLDLLSNNLVYVTFDKLDGEERTMMCTLLPEYLPEATKEDTLIQTKVRNLEDKVIVVWSVAVNAWRSFRYDNLKKAEVYTPSTEPLTFG